MFVFFLIAVSVPAITVSAFSIKNSTDNIIKQTSRANASILLEKEYITRQRLDEIEDYVYWLISNKDISNLVASENVESVYYQLKMADILRLLKNRSEEKKLIESVYLYDTKHDFILSDAKYSKENFYDRGVLKLEFDGNKFVGIRQSTPVGSGSSEKVVSYIRRFPLLHSDNTVFIVININYDMFFNDLLNNDYKYPKGILIFDRDYSVVYLKSDFLNGLRNADLMDIAGENDSFVKKIDGKDYFICKIYSSVLNWTLVFIQPYADMVQTARLVKNTILYSLLIIMLLSFAMSYYFSKYLYKPLAKLVMDVKSISDVKIPDGQKKLKTNEYKIIEGTIKKLFNANYELVSKYEMAFPYFKNHFTYDMLMNESFDPEKFKSFLDVLGIYFEYSRFLTAIIDFENTEFNTEIANKLDSLLSDYKQGLNYIFSSMNNSRIIILVNTEYDVEMISFIVLRMKESFNQGGIELTISIGKPYEDVKKIHLSYIEALRQIENKFFIGKNEIINYSDTAPADKTFCYDRKYEYEMLNYIKAQNRDKATQALDKLTAQITSESGSIEYLKYIYFQIINNIIYSLEDIGVGPSEMETSTLGIFEKIKEAGTLNELQLFTNSFLEKCVLLLKALKERKHTALVNNTIEYIKSNFQNDLSLEEIAEKFFLNHRYLNSIFKAETGITIFDYIIKMRLEKAASLILNQKLKIQDVAKMVGYNSVQSFIRLFKIHYKITPLEYRKKYGNQF